MSYYNISKMSLHTHKFEKIYDQILAINNSSAESIDKWNKIAELIDKHQEIYVDLFRALKRVNNKNIRIDYSFDRGQLRKQILTEKDDIIKISLIITELHHIVYDLFRARGNHHSSMLGKEEMNMSNNDTIYYSHFSFKNEQNIFFHAFILQYALESLFNKHFYIGIDYEYTFRKIQLAQLNFEHCVSTSVVMIVSPPELAKTMTNNLVELIMCNKRIIKILHGADSLDIPYIYGELLENDPDKIISFTNTMVDTRFLCEYYKLNKFGSIDHVCKLYDEDKNKSAIYYFGVVNDEKQQQLQEMVAYLPPANDRTWYINKLSKTQILYSQYDVIFLKYFYYRIIYLATTDVNTDEEKKAVIQLYKHVLFELSQFTLLDNRGITSLKTKCKEETDPLNNYMIRRPNKVWKLIDIYKLVQNGLKTSNPRADIDKIMKVPQYKKSIDILLKKIIYTILSKKYHILKDKTSSLNDRLDNQYVFDFLKTLNYHYLHDIFLELEQTLDDKLVKLI